MKSLFHIATAWGIIFGILPIGNYLLREPSLLDGSVEMNHPIAIENEQNALIEKEQKIAMEKKQKFTALEKITHSKNDLLDSAEDDALSAGIFADSKKRLKKISSNSNSDPLASNSDLLASNSDLLASNSDPLVNNLAQENIPKNNFIQLNLKKIIEFFQGVIDQIARLRSGFNITGGPSIIDSNVNFTGLSDIILYLPRAIQIGFTAPFPELLLQKGSSKFMTIARKITFLEMIIIYACLLGLPCTLLVQRSNPELWIVVYISIGMLIMYTLVVSNLGTLHRFRYPFLMTFTGLGVIGLKYIYFSLKTHSKNFSKKSFRSE
ncbi:MAG: hypothetical protein HQK52_01530 [Oligoflexia bacterium]|nr:hypothetical protein [Oligoflexia bacterium]